MQSLLYKFKVPSIHLVAVIFSFYLSEAVFVLTPKTLHTLLFSGTCWNAIKTNNNNSAINHSLN